jgi:class 3 adenylate cyclase
VGINSGPVTVGDIGSRDFRRDFTVIGDVVNVAQRVQSSAAVDEVLVGESTHALIGQGLAFGAPRPLQLKGRSAQELAWPVLWGG